MKKKAYKDVPEILPKQICCVIKIFICIVLKLQYKSQNLVCE